MDGKSKNSSQCGPHLWTVVLWTCCLPYQMESHANMRSRGPLKPFCNTPLRGRSAKCSHDANTKSEHFIPTLSHKSDYLIIGTDGSSRWTQAKVIPDYCELSILRCTLHDNSQSLVDVDYTSIQSFRVGSMPDRHRCEVYLSVDRCPNAAIGWVSSTILLARLY